MRPLNLISPDDYIMAYIKRGCYFYFITNHRQTYNSRI